MTTSVSKGKGRRFGPKGRAYRERAVRRLSRPPPTRATIVASSVGWVLSGNRSVEDWLASQRVARRESGTRIAVASDAKTPDART